MSLFLKTSCNVRPILHAVLGGLRARESACIQDAAYVSSTSPRMIDKIIIAENNFSVEQSALDDAGSLIPCFGGGGESGNSRTRKL